MMVIALEWEDGPSCALFSEGTEDYEWMNQKVGILVKHVQTPNASSSDVQNSIPSVPNFDNTPQVERPSNLPTATFDTAPKLPRANDIPGPVFDVSPISFKNASSDGPQVVVDLHETIEANVAVRGESNSLGKQSKKKRVAVSPDNVPTMKKIKVDAHGNDQIQDKKTKEKRASARLHIEIDGFHTSLENFHASLKPRAEIDNEVMTLYLKTFNYDQSVKKKKPKKIVFSVLMSLKLSAEPDVFDPKVCEKEFKNACLQNHISKSDLLFFMVVHKKHWAVVVVNITQKEFNIFDSIRNSEDLFEMDRITKNVVMLLLEFGATNLFLLFAFPHRTLMHFVCPCFIRFDQVANIKSVAMREPLFKHNLESYSLFTPLDYPQ
nr:uncharacterized protein LOC120962707 isoform X1 [Aegilops tauschii subsp. strangulata]